MFGKKFVFVLFLVVGCVATSFISSSDGDGKLSATNMQSVEPQRASKKVQAKTICVQVSGAVLEPGIYELPADSRAEAVIAAAGGFTEEADTERVNLVRKLRDGMLVRVPVRKAAKTSAAKAAGNRKSSKVEAQPTVKRVQKRKSDAAKN